MYIALNVGKFALILVFGIAYFLGLGWLVIRPLLYRSWSARIRERSVFNEIPLLLLSGLIINYGIVLCFQSLNISLILGGILSIVGFICFLWPFFRYPKSINISDRSTYRWIGITLFCLVTISPILAEPISAWDARSFWFFHAKMIYYAGSIGKSAGWLHPSVAISHFDYPNFVPALGAQISHIMGFWNEYLPKFSLFFMYIPAIFWLLTFMRRSFSFIFLVLLIPFSFYPWIWNGYMDGLLAIYFSISLLLFGRFIQSSQPIDLISTFCCLFAIVNIKNEGSLAILSGGFAIIIFMLLEKTIKSIYKIFKWKYILVSLIALLPYIIWIFDKKQWSLVNDLGIGTIESFKRIIIRLNDGSFIIIFQNILDQIRTPLMMLGLLTFVLLLWKIPIEKDYFPAFITALIYCLGIISIFMLSPADLNWHLATAVERTMLPVNGLLFVVCYFILSSYECFMSNKGNMTKIAKLKGI